jgi:hypothetical protein
MGYDYADDDANDVRDLRGGLGGGGHDDDC